MRAVVLLFFFFLFLYEPALAEERGEISGAVAYTDIIRFDYTQDGVRDRVQFWIEFTGKTAVGNAEEDSYLPAEGGISYYLLDVDKKERVTNWLMGFSMMAEPPPSGPYPISNLIIQGNRATFDAFNRKWEILDEGPGFEQDTVLVDDGFKAKPMKMYDGDINVQAGR